MYYSINSRTQSVYDSFYSWLLEVQKHNICVAYYSRNLLHVVQTSELNVYGLSLFMHSGTIFYSLISGIKMTKTPRNIVRGSIMHEFEKFRRQHALIFFRCSNTTCVASVILEFLACRRHCVWSYLFLNFGGTQHVYSIVALFPTYLGSKYRM